MLRRNVSKLGISAWRWWGGIGDTVAAGAPVTHHMDAGVRPPGGPTAAEYASRLIDRGVKLYQRTRVQRRNQWAGACAHGEQAQA